MVSLLPPQSDVTLPGPTRLEGEPHRDLMQAPGLPGSPAPQSVSTWRLGLVRPSPEGRVGNRRAVTPTLQGPPWGLSCPFHQQTTTQWPQDPEVFRYAYSFRLGIFQSRNMHPSSGAPQV